MAWSSLAAAEIEYPQVIRTGYEAADPKIGGNFIVWPDRERIFYGRDPKHYPAACFVEVTQVAPAVGSGTLTKVERRTVNSTTSDYLYLSGNVRFGIGGRVLKTSNFPSGGGMVP